MKPRWWTAMVLSEDRLRIEARWLLAWLGSQPAGWRYSVDAARHASGLGKEKYFQILGEIKALGYVETDHKRDRLGRIIFTRLIINDTANPESGKSGIRIKRHRNPDSKDSGPESGKSGQTSLSDREAPSQEIEAPRFRLVVGGRDA